MPTPRRSIDDFLSHKRLAFVGLSTDEAAFSCNVCADMRKNGYEIVPVNPKATEADGRRGLSGCVHSESGSARGE